jgi:NAD(P)-dependent dehydrogenase (short-subunit alcohol dehydrogenase family)
VGVMIVTGGSRGIGAAIARRAAAQGWSVCVGYRERSDAAKDVVVAIEAGGGTGFAVRADVAIEHDVVRLFDETRTRLGTVTALVNNAGIHQPEVVAEMTASRLQAVFSTNTFGPYLCAREAVRCMSTARGGGGGVIVNVSSVAAVFGGMRGDVVYAGSKAAVDALTLGLAREVAEEGIRVCGVRPGLTATELWGGESSLEQVERQAPAAVPLGRLATPDEIAGAVLWLCSDEASYVTGAILNVSGGREIDIPPSC